MTPCAGRVKRGVRRSESTPKGRMSTRAHMGPTLGLGFTTQMALPASSLPNLEGDGAWIIWGIPSAARICDKSVALIEARDYGGPSFWVEV